MKATLCCVLEKLNAKRHSRNNSNLGSDSSWVMNGFEFQFTYEICGGYEICNTRSTLSCCSMRQMILNTIVNMLVKLRVTLVSMGGFWIHFTIRKLEERWIYITTMYVHTLMPGQWLRWNMHQHSNITELHLVTKSSYPWLIATNIFCLSSHFSIDEGYA